MKKEALKILLKKLGMSLNDLDLQHLYMYLCFVTDKNNTKVLFPKPDFDVDEYNKGELVFNTINGL